MNDALIDSYGLGYQTLFASQGNVCADKFDDILQTLKDDKIDFKTKHFIAKQLPTWASIAPAREQVLLSKYSQIFSTIEHLILLKDDDDAYLPDKEYEGVQSWANSLAQMIGNACSMDTSQKLSSLLCSHSYALIDKILKSGVKLTEKTPFNKESSGTYRSESIKCLLRIAPYQGSINVPTAMTVYKVLLTDPNIPQSLKVQAGSSIQSMTMVNKEGMKNSGNEIMAIIKNGNTTLVTTFATMPELYANAPESVEKNIDFLLTLPYNHVASIFYAVAQKNPLVFSPYVSKFIERLSTDAMMGTLTLMILKNIADIDPNTIFPRIKTILVASQSISQSDTMLSQLLSSCGQASEPADAADQAMLHIIELMKSSNDSNLPALALSGISNLLSRLSSVEKIRPHLEFLHKFRASAEIVMTTIDDFAAGRSLEKLTTRVDEMEVKINAMNAKVSECCKNFDEVKDYVDAHIADLKDFVSEIAKKLPTPRRLEVVGTLRKTLILHFECVHTGYEYPVTSTEWSKWLKMGFSLIKAGQAVIDIGMGNPLGLLKKGIDCIGEIYAAYKERDDAEFNSYITNPFLTSSEQDMLLDKLRGQGFFDAFAYDAQAPGWYLINPEKDGKPPEGTDGGVSRVQTKEGYGILSEIKAVAGLVIENSPLADAYNQAMDIKETVEFVANGAVSAAKAVSNVVNGKYSQEETNTDSPIHPQSPPAPRRVAPAPQSKTQTVPVTDADRLKIADLERRVALLEQQIVSLNNKKGCCTVS